MRKVADLTEAERQTVEARARAIPGASPQDILSSDELGVDPRRYIAMRGVTTIADYVTARERVEAETRRQARLAEAVEQERRALRSGDAA
jgi:hypothetical protein